MILLLIRIIVIGNYSNVRITSNSIDFKIKYYKPDIKKSVNIRVSFNPRVVKEKDSLKS